MNVIDGDPHRAHEKLSSSQPLLLLFLRVWVLKFFENKNMDAMRLSLYYHSNMIFGTVINEIIIRDYDYIINWETTIQFFCVCVCSVCLLPQLNNNNSYYFVWIYVLNSNMAYSNEEIIYTHANRRCCKHDWCPNIRQFFLLEERHVSLIHCATEMYHYSVAFVNLTTKWIHLS